MTLTINGETYRLILALEPDPKASGADDSGVIHGFRDNSEALIRDVDASA
jgi:hypothetical protein